MRRGFILGKFMPPHQGHIFLCETGLNMVDELTVLVCSTDDETMEGTLRYRWMADLLPRVKVRHLHRNLPQTPEEHPDFWTIWRAAIKEQHPQPIDYIFGSEHYIFKLAEVLGASPVIIDPKREVFNISASAVRTNPFQHWAYLPKPIQEHYAKRICILGPESSGKSVLASALAKAYQTSLMPEYGRIYDEEYKQVHGGPRYWQDSELLMLARTHVAMCQAVLPSANKVLFEDTDPFQTAIWEFHLMGSISKAMESFLDFYKPADYYVILSSSVGFVDDGGRYFEDQHIRQDFFDRAVSYVKARGIPYTVIMEKDWQQRTQLAFEGVAEFLGYNPSNRAVDK